MNQHAEHSKKLLLLGFAERRKDTLIEGVFHFRGLGGNFFSACRKVQLYRTLVLFRPLARDQAIGLELEQYLDQIGQLDSQRVGDFALGNRRIVPDSDER